LKVDSLEAIIGFLASKQHRNPKFTLHLKDQVVLSCKICIYIHQRANAASQLQDKRKLCRPYCFGCFFSCGSQEIPNMRNSSILFYTFILLPLVTHAGCLEKSTHFYWVFSGKVLFFGHPVCIYIFFNGT